MIEGSGTLRSFPMKGCGVRDFMLLNQIDAHTALGKEVKIPVTSPRS